MMENNSYKKRAYQNTEQNEGCSCRSFLYVIFVIFILQETKKFNLFDKNFTQENVRC